DKKPRKDRVLQWLPPYGKDDVKVIYETPDRIISLQYAEDGQTLFLTQTVEGQRQIVAVDLRDPKTPYVIHAAKAPAAGGEEPEPESPFTPPADDFPDGGLRGEQFKGKGFGGGTGLTPVGLMTRAGRGEARVVRMSSEGEVYVAGTDRSGGAVYPR